MAESRDRTTPASPLKPTALTIEDAAKILSATYGKAITAEMVRTIAERGDLLQPDGTINLVHYAAWLVKEISRGH